MKQPKQFTKNLTAWYQKNARDLPWRRTKDPYKIWISEIMLQQTTVNTVIPYWERWVKAFPKIEDVASASLHDILKSWQGLGYYSRARNIHKSSQIILKEFKGKLPEQEELIKKLPGFGPYTTGAVLSIAFDKRLPIIDANVRRVMMRVLAKQGFADTTHDEEILETLDQVIPQKGVGDFNQALMELGALICRSKEPLCLLCPIREQCQGFQKGIQELIPTPKKKIIHDINVAIGIMRHDGKYFIQKRHSKGLFADLWEFPGGKVEKGETVEQALRRELKEELNVEVGMVRSFASVRHFYTQFRVDLHAFICESGTFPAEHPNRRWVTQSQLLKYPMPSGSAKIVDKLVKFHQNHSEGK